MIGWESRVLFRHYLAEGLSKLAIAERLGINRKTVSRWIRKPMGSWPACPTTRKAGAAAGRASAATDLEVAAGGTG